jgi:dipeptidyl aminopeptidase/acylaminoacyl peptidase
VPTQLVIYPNQNHGISIPSYRVDRMRRVLDWYGTYLLGELKPTLGTNPGAGW